MSRLASPHDSTLQTDHLPAIRRLHPVRVNVTEHGVYIKKFGISDFAGFIVTAEGAQANDGVKIINGLYWTDAW